MTELEGAEAQALLARRQQIQVNPEKEKRGAVFVRIMRVSLCTKEAFPPHVWED
jgi:hypothetical protein